MQDIAYIWPLLLMARFVGVNMLSGGHGRDPMINPKAVVDATHKDNRQVDKVMQWSMGQWNYLPVSSPAYSRLDRVHLFLEEYIYLANIAVSIKTFVAFYGGVSWPSLAGLFM